jgi:hypothetical protein
LDKELLKFAERAGDVLVEFSRQEKKNLKAPDEAAKDFLEKGKNLKSIEAKFMTNSIDVLYNYLKYKYPREAGSEKAEKLITILKGLADKEDEDSLNKTKLVHQQLVAEMQNVENRIKGKNPDYKKKFS